MNLPSKYQIYDEIDVLIPGRSLILKEDISIPDDVNISGIVVAVRFTKGKVFYDILDDIGADVFRDIDSSYVIEPFAQKVVARA